MPGATLILGGARSGKSRRALSLAEATAPDRVYIATAEALDDEMANRIARHREERGPGWTTEEVPLELAQGLNGAADQGDVCVVDCLTLWLSNLFHYERDVETATAELKDAIQSSSMPIILVSNEIGLGLVPETALGRHFRDAQGRLNQEIAAICSSVEFMAAGIAMPVKG